MNKIESRKEDHGAGCALLIAFVALSTGTGYLFGVAYGFLMFGVLMLALAILTPR